jgi:hypothetical protein
MLRHLEYLTLKLRRHELATSGIALWLRDRTYTHSVGTTKKLSTPSETENAILPALSKAFSEIYEHNQAYTQTGLLLFNLTPSGMSQLSLLTDPTEHVEDELLQESLDRLHDRFGRNAITRGAALAVKSGTKKRMGLSLFEEGGKREE